jgi:hypothetical protein
LDFGPIAQVRPWDFSDDSSSKQLLAVVLTALAAGVIKSNVSTPPQDINDLCVRFFARSASRGEMIKSKKKYRNLQVARRAKTKATDTRELVLTLSIPDGEVVKVETLEKSGKRHELSEEEFAALAGEDEAEDISPEEAYAAGITDATKDEFELDEEGDDEEAIERSVLREMVTRQLLRRGVRRFILRRLRRRESIRQRARPGGKGTHETVQKGLHKIGNGHEGVK